MFKTVLLSLTLAASSISCVSAKPLTEVSKVSITPVIVPKNQSNLETNQNVKLEFNTIHDSKGTCDQENFGFTWQDLEDDLEYYGMGWDKISWLMSPYYCTQVRTLGFNNVIIYELYDKNSPLYVFYIYETKKNKRVLVTVTRTNSLQHISEGKRKYLGDLDSFSKGKFILDQYIDEQSY
ncbi:hypothetical protein DABAL43B_1066 [Psychrobacter sp. DAB_AL43B]|nr:hypothetical protein DABAL43B_1066 [Psychrobacter sp. DAB_AL43B]